MYYYYRLSPYNLAVTCPCNRFLSQPSERLHFMDSFDGYASPPHPASAVTVRIQRFPLAPAPSRRQDEMKHLMKPTIQSTSQN